MPRAGGESGKLGNQYESVWTVDALLDVPEGRALSLTAEPFDRGQEVGIESPQHSYRLQNEALNP